MRSLRILAKLSDIRKKGIMLHTAKFWALILLLSNWFSQSIDINKPNIKQNTHCTFDRSLCALGAERHLAVHQRIAVNLTTFSLKRVYKHKQRDSKWST